jgi:hypothetical protein
MSQKPIGKLDEWGWLNQNDFFISSYTNFIKQTDFSLIFHIRLHHLIFFQVDEI